MPKRKDPAVSVLRYFETADIGQARLVLSLAKDAVARRSGPESSGGARPARTRRSGTGAGPGPGTGDATGALDLPLPSRLPPPRRPPLSGV
jgi:hypothetical protein